MYAFSTMFVAAGGLSGEHTFVSDTHKLNVDA